MAILAPTLTATPASCSQVDLSWTRPIDAVGPEMIPFTTWPDSSIEPYVILLAPGKMYRYVDGPNEGPVSEGFPEGETTYFVADASGVIALNWTGFAPVTSSLKEVRGHYRVYRNGAVLIELPGDQAAYTDSTAVAGTPYTYTVERIEGSETAMSAKQFLLTPICDPITFPLTFNFLAPAQMSMAIDSADNIIFTLPIGFPTFGVVLVKLAADGSIVWTKLLPYTRQYSSFFLSSRVVVDASDNILLCGEFLGLLDCGGSILDSTSAGQRIYTAKFNSSGVHQWSAMRASTSRRDYEPRIAVNGVGEVFVAATANRTDPNSDLYGALNLVLFSYAANGTLRFNTTVPARADTTASAIQCDSDGNAWVLGDGLWIITGNCGDQLVPAADFTRIQDWFLMKIDRVDGGCLGFNWIGVAGVPDFSKTMLIDPSDNLFLVGETQGGINFGGGSRTRPPFNGANPWPGVVKYGPGVNWIWDTEWETSSRFSYYSMVLDNTGRLWVGGSGPFPMNLIFAGQPVSVTSSGTHALLTRYTSAGAQDAAFTYSSPPPEPGGVSDPSSVRGLGKLSSGQVVALLQRSGVLQIIKPT